MRIIQSVATKLTFANVVACLALVIATGGTAAYAADIGKNTVGSKQIVNSSITSKDVKDKSLTGEDVDDGTITGGDVKDGSLTGADVAGDSLGGGQINEQTLGAVPNAAALGGVPASAYGRVIAHTRRSFTTGSPFRMTVPGFGTVGFNCQGDGRMPYFESLSGPAGGFGKLRAYFSDFPTSDASVVLYNADDGSTDGASSETQAAFHVDAERYLSNAAGTVIYLVVGTAYNDPEASGCNANMDIIQLAG
jgi:hypothetical protein